MKFQVQVTHQAHKDLRRLPGDRRYALLGNLKRLEEDPMPDGDVIKAIAADPKGRHAA